MNLVRSLYGGQMSTPMDAEAIPRAAVTGTASGLILMAGFTFVWGAWATAGLGPVASVVAVGIFLIPAVSFIIHGVGLFRAAGRFPTIDTVQRQEETATIGRWHGRIFALEGSLIGVACTVLGVSGNYLYINPAIALIVGAHFIPLARVFHRTIDYYIGTWVMLASLLGIYLLAFTSTQPLFVWTIVSIATACGTTAYGLYMVRTKWSFLRSLNSSSTRIGV